MWKKLDYDGSLTVRAAFDLSYQHLARGPARLFRLLTLNPGPEISTDAAVALSNCGTSQTRRLLGSLLRAHLLQPGSVRGCWRMHDLLRLYAAEQAAADTDREAALGRLLGYYVATTQAANQYLDTRAVPPDRRSPFTTRQDAVNWMDLEHPNLVGAASLSYDSGRYAHTVDLANAMYEFFWLRLHVNDWIATHQMALAAARKRGDRCGECRLLHHLGWAFWRTRRYDEAASHNLEALTISREVGDRRGEADALRGLGAAERGMNHPILAERFFRHALPLFREVGDQHREAKVLNGIGLCYVDTGSHDQAAVHYHQAQQIFRRLGDRDGEAHALGNLGNLYTNLRDWDAAVEYHCQALLIWQELDDRHGQAGQMNNLGIAYERTERWKEAAHHQEQAVQLYRECGDDHGEAGSLHSLGTIYRQLSRLDQAMTSYQQALHIRRELHGTLDDQAETLAGLGDTCYEAGRPDEAECNWREALAYYNAIRSEHAQTRAMWLRSALGAMGFEP